MNPSETFIIIDYFIALFLRLLLRFFQDWLLNFANRIRYTKIKRWIDVFLLLSNENFSTRNKREHRPSTDRSSRSNPVRLNTR